MDDRLPYIVIEAPDGHEKRMLLRPELNETIPDVFEKKGSEAVLVFANGVLDDARSSEGVMADIRKDRHLDSELLNFQLAQKLPGVISPLGDSREFLPLVARTRKAFTGQDDGQLTADNTEVERTTVHKFGDPGNQERVSAFILTPKRS